MYLVYPNSSYLLEIKHYHYFYKYSPHHYGLSSAPYSYDFSNFNVETFYILFLISSIVSLMTCVACNSKKVPKKIKEKNIQTEPLVIPVKAETYSV